MAENRKKRVLFHSNYCGVATGFGLFMRELLGYLYKTGKYDLHLYASGVTWNNPDFARWPWKCYGALPNDSGELQRLQQDPHTFKMASYGAHYIDRVMREVRPDVYIGIEDFWGLNYCLDKPWWNKIGCMVSWTADSLPLLPEAVEKSDRILHHFVWADFATQEFHRLASDIRSELQHKEDEFLSKKWNSKEEYQSESVKFTKFREFTSKKIAGLERVQTLRGTVNSDVYHRLTDTERKALRERFGISQDTFCVGTLSRNQLRKLFPNLIEGYVEFKKRNPEIKSKLLFFTYFAEGWDIPRLAKQFGLLHDDILACYKCRATGEWFVIPYRGEEIDNPKTGDKKSMVTVNISNGLSYSDVNRWYNLLDVFCLPITSGGQERALQEAKLCELITLINPHTCGEDNCVFDAASLPLEFSRYPEIGSQFIKASPYPSSIAKQLTRVLKMDNRQRREMGEKARDWVLRNFSIDVIGKRYEELIDSFPLSDHDFDVKKEAKNPNAAIPEISDNIKWVQTLYELILRCSNVPVDDEGVKYWVESLSRGMPRGDVERFFRQVAEKDNRELGKESGFKLDNYIDNNNRKRYLLVIKESIGDCLMVTSLLSDLSRQYPDYDIYVATDLSNFPIFDGSPYIYKVIPYDPCMESELAMTGHGENKGKFDAYCHVAVSAQRFLNYVSRHSPLLDIHAST